MRRSLAACVALALCSASSAWAQPEEKPDADEAAEEKPVAEPKADAVPEEPPADREPPPPVLPDPRPDEQDPGPYVPPPEPQRKERKLELGPDIGITARTAEGDELSYDPGFTYGAHIRIELVSFLGFRAYFNNSFHAVDGPASAYGDVCSGPICTPYSKVEQDDVQVTVLGARLEPTWVVTPELRLWAGLGVAWGRVNAEEVKTNPPVANFDRTGVLLEWTGSIGASYDVIPDWLAVSLLVNGGVVSNQSGNVFDSVQVIDQNSGTIAQLGGLPKFESTFSVLLGLGIVL